MNDRFCNVCGESALAFDYHVTTRYAGKRKTFCEQVCFHCREILDVMLETGQLWVRRGEVKQRVKMRLELVE